MNKKKKKSNARKVISYFLFTHFSVYIFTKNIVYINNIIINCKTRHHRRLARTHRHITPWFSLCISSLSGGKKNYMKCKRTNVHKTCSTKKLCDLLAIIKHLYNRVRELYPDIYRYIELWTKKHFPFPTRSDCPV